jgi:DNA-binding CsgD family transcriptional regulator
VHRGDPLFRNEPIHDRYPLSAATFTHMDGREMNVEGQIEAGYKALADGDWDLARTIFMEVLSAADTPEAHSGLASAHWWLGDMSGTMDCYERAYAGFRRRGDFAEAATMALLLSFHSDIHLANRTAGKGWLRRAIRLIEDNRLETLRGHVALFQGCLETDASVVESCARTAVEFGRKSNDPDLELCALSLLGHALIDQGRVAEGLPLLDETMAAALGGEPQQLDTVVFTSCNMMVSCSKCAAFERAAAWVRASEAFTERFGCPFLFAECRLIYGIVLFYTGKWAEAEVALRTALEMSNDAIPAFTASATAVLAQLRLAQGKIEEAETLCEEIVSFEQSLPVRARLHLVQGRPDLAAGLARRHFDDRPELQLDRILSVEILGEAEIALGDAASAIERGEALVALGEGGGCRMAVARGKRLIGNALSRTDHESARWHLDRARQEFGELGMPLEVGITSLALTGTLSDSEEEVAIAEARAALGSFEALGASHYCDEAAALLRDLGIKNPRSGPRTDGEISPREEEVMSLLALGLSNPEIADRLFISRKTVEHHVSSLLGKLDLRNRSEAAAEAVRRGIT